MDRQRVFAGAAPHALVRIGKKRVDHVTKPAAGVPAIFVRQLFDSELGHARVSVRRNCRARRPLRDATDSNTSQLKRATFLRQSRHWEC